MTEFDISDGSGVDILRIGGKGMLEDMADECGLGMLSTGGNGITPGDMSTPLALDVVLP